MLHDASVDDAGNVHDSEVDRPIAGWPEERSGCRTLRTDAYPQGVALLDVVLDGEGDVGHHVVNVLHGSPDVLQGVGPRARHAELMLHTVRGTQLVDDGGVAFGEPLVEHPTHHLERGRLVGSGSLWGLGGHGVLLVPEAALVGASSIFGSSRGRFDQVTVDPNGGDVNGNRGYHSPLREHQARQTRARVVKAAHGLFLRDGYPATTLAAVAEEAGVSVHTIYGAFGSKVALLRKVVDAAVGGDDKDVGILERSGPQAMRQEIDQRRQLEMFAAGMAGQLERVGPIDAILRSAATVDPEAAALREDIQLGQRRQAMRTVVGWVAARGPLRDGMGCEEAAAIVWTLTSPEVHTMLGTAWGWSSQRYVTWLADALIAGLLPDRAT